MTDTKPYYTVMAIDRAMAGLGGKPGIATG